MNAKRKASIGIESLAEFKEEKKNKQLKQEEDFESNEFSDLEQKSFKSSTNHNEISLNNDQSLTNQSNFLKKNNFLIIKTFGKKFEIENFFNFHDYNVAWKVFPALIQRN